MTIWAIADIHASRTDVRTGQPVKPMDVFGERWKGHLDRLDAAWHESIAPEDTVLIAGDIDWALYLHDAAETIERLHRWPGRKILIRGNHDYWWSSKSTNRVRAVLPPDIELLHNTALVAEGFNVCGAKGSAVPGGLDWTPQDEKILAREVGRLQTSLAGRDSALPTIGMLHYPPFYPSHPATPYRAALDSATVALCVYGHLHGGSAAAGPHGLHGATEYRLVAADTLDFRPCPVAHEGALLPGR